MRKQIATSLEEDIIRKSKFLALEKGIKLNEYIENALNLYFEYHHVNKFLDERKLANKLTDDDIVFGYKQLLRTGIR